MHEVKDVIRVYPCPLCRSENIRVEKKYGAQQFHRVRCASCGCRLNFVQGDIYEAVDLWNTRIEYNGKGLSFAVFENNYALPMWLCKKNLKKFSNKG